MKLPRVVSPRGMLSPWAMRNGTWKKKVAWHFYQRRDLESATAFHVTSSLEADEVRALGLRQPIALVNNGLELPKSMPKRVVSQQPNALFLSRIHPKKGLLNLVRAWGNTPELRDWKLRIVGPDEGGHKHQIQAEASRLGISDNVQFIDHVDDQVKWQFYREADLFVLPSFSENFGIVVAEALAAGVPVITTRSTPWSELPSQGCGWWVEPTEGALQSALTQAARLSRDELRRMGQAGETWANERFSWNASAEGLVRFYQWLLEGGEAPEFVIL